MGFGARLEQLISAVAPSIGRRRASDRWRTTILEQSMGMLGNAQRQYAGAAMTDQTALWAPPASSGNSEVAMSIDWLVRRSRQLARDEPLIAAAGRRLVSNAIGEGERCTIDHPDRKVAAQAQALWNAVMESTEIDADGLHDFYGLQCLTLRSAIEGGNCLVRRRWRKIEDGGVLPFKLQVLEGEHLDCTRDHSERDRLVKRGIVFNALRERDGYYLYSEHPGEFFWGLSPESRFVPANSVAHVFRCERPGMVAGVPWGSSTLLLARQLGDWRHATMVRMVAQGALVAFVTEIDPDENNAPLSPGNATGNMPTTLNSGSVEYLRSGQEVKFSNPPGAAGIDNFVLYTRQEIAVAFGVPYEVLTGDLSKVNFSSGRMGWLEFQRELKIWRRDVLRRPFNDRVFRWFLEAAVLAGKLRDDGLFKATWTPSRREFVDAKAEIQGIVAKCRAGLSTWSEEARELGWDPRELAETFAADLKMLDALGLAFECDPRTATAGSAAPPPAKSDDKSKDKSGDEGDDEDPSNEDEDVNEDE